MKLYSYWRSTTSYRVRIGLELKGLRYMIAPINLLVGEQRSPEYLQVAKFPGVPTLETDDGQLLLGQSLAILDYLDHIAPQPSLYPSTAALRAQVQSASLTIACDIHPLSNLRVLTYLNEIGQGSHSQAQWVRHWFAEGLQAFQNQIASRGLYSFGTEITLADLCLVPQLYSARRWQVDLERFDRLIEIERACLALPAFQAAHPNTQPDAKTDV